MPFGGTRSRSTHARSARDSLQGIRNSVSYSAKLLVVISIVLNLVTCDNESWPEVATPRPGLKKRFRNLGNEQQPRSATDRSRPPNSSRVWPRDRGAGSGGANATASFLVPRCPRISRSSWKSPASDRRRVSALPDWLPCRSHTGLADPRRRWSGNSFTVNRSGTVMPHARSESRQDKGPDGKRLIL